MPNFAPKVSKSATSQARPSGASSLRYRQIRFLTLAVSPKLASDHAW